MTRFPRILATVLLTVLPATAVVAVAARSVARSDPQAGDDAGRPAPTVRLAPAGGPSAHAPSAQDPAASRRAAPAVAAQASSIPPDLDARVTRFLQDRRATWRDMNVPDADGRHLHDLVLKRGYRRALEIGTSTGHSGIWTAWALAKTGGRLVTIDIDEGRHAEAVANFKEAGLAALIDARLADAHDLVPKLAGPFDFVFIDADKDWYINYAKAVLPKLEAGGCLAAHNVSPGRGWRSMGADYYAFITSLPDFDTTIVNGSLAISIKRK